MSQNILFNSLYDEKHRWPIWFPVFFGVGIFFYFQLSQEPTTLALFFIFLGVILCLISLFIKKISTKFKWIFVFILIFLLGFICALSRTWSIHYPVINQVYTGLRFSAEIGEIEKKITKWSVVLKLAPEYLKIHPELPQQVKLNFYPKQPELYKTGDKIDVLVDLYPIPKPTTLYGFNFRKHLYFQEIGAIGNVKEVLAHTPRKSVSTLLSLREWTTNLIKIKFDPTRASLISALVIGDRASIPQEIRQNFTDSGIAHILAISGLHLSLLAGVVFLIFRRGLSFFPYVAETYSTKKIAAALALAISFIYLALSGFGVPAQRAFVMIGFAMIAVILDRNPLSMVLVAIAALLLLIIHPENLMQASFQLSFAAVITLIAFYEQGGPEFLHKMVQKGSFYKPLSYFLGVIITTVIATIGTTPFTISIFSQYTLQSIPGNLIAIPLMGIVVMPFLFLFMITGYLSPDSYIMEKIQWVLNQSMDIMVYSTNIISKWPGGSMKTAESPTIFISLIVLGGLWMCIWQRKWRWYGLIPIALSFLFYKLHPLPAAIITRNLIAYYNEDSKTLYLTDSINNQFQIEVLLKSYGLKNYTPLRETFTIRHGKDVMALIPNRYIHYTKAYEQCKNASLVLSMGYISPYCLSTKAIDYGALLESNYIIEKAPKGFTAIGLSKNKRPWS